MSKGTIVIDLDGTLCAQTPGGDAYKTAAPRPDTIRKVSTLWTDGWKIIIHTARGMKTCEGDVSLVEMKYRQITEQWLKDNRVAYDKLIFGKPAGDVYVDDKGMSVNDFERKDF